VSTPGEEPTGAVAEISRLVLTGGQRGYALADELQAIGPVRSVIAEAARKRNMAGDGRLGAFGPSS
jgi:hypothetical protein